MAEVKKSRFVTRVESLSKYFYSLYNETPEEVFTSPGRIELLGNHTDHNHGKVLVSSIDLNILSVSKKTNDNKLVYQTKGYPIMEVDLDDLTLREEEYGQSIGLIRGVLFKMKELGYKIGGVKIATTTTIFKGAGVSSSAAFELLIARMMAYYYNDNKIDAFTLAQIAQFAECVYFNKPCGLLDQSGISLGGVNYIDFKDINKPVIETVTFPLTGFDLVLTNCVDSHAQLTHLYAKIKEDMLVLSNYFGKDYLREISSEEFFSKKDELIKKFGEDVYLRGKHYYEENVRVEKAFECVKNYDVEGFIKYINESGESSFYQLKNCYVNGTNENLPQGILRSKEIIKHGAVRVHGGGFAGTIIAIVDKDETIEYMNAMKELFGSKNVKRIALNRYGTRFVCMVNDAIDVTQLSKVD